jgi:hypothetical protein
MRSRRGVATAVVAALAIAVPGSAAAKTVTYGGGIFPSGKIAFDVKVNKKKKPKRIVAVRAIGVPIECDQSGPNTASLTASKLEAKVTGGGFDLVLVQPKFGNKTKLTGEFKQKNKKLGGGITYDYHFPAEGDLPEEDCNSETLLYGAKRGGKDVVVPQAAAVRRR